VVGITADDASPGKRETQDADRPEGSWAHFSGLVPLASMTLPGPHFPQYRDQKLADPLRNTARNGTVNSALTAAAQSSPTRDGRGVNRG
jgi:hypothetical protein